ncbi:hypothetical protein G6F43_008825 [Rhizopus delemar]|nr:hypothetical protein G6F43_008825 [Rhizopus delemar]
MKLDTTNKVSFLYFLLTLVLFSQFTDYPTQPTHLSLFNQSTQEPEYKPPIDPNAKYITFFTHSGFQNQLIQVENAILLAWFLNRTLILPKAILGDSFGWNNFDRLNERHNLLYARCEKNKKSCLKKKYAVTSFDKLIDLSWAKQHVQMIDKNRPDFQWLEDQLDIKIADHNQSFGSFISGDVLFFKDQTRYDWRFFDKPSKYQFLGKYKDGLNISTLKERKEKLIYFTSLFGTGKFSIKDPHHQQFFKTLQQTMIYKHPAVLRMSEIVVHALAVEFVGVHLRTRDGLFVEAVPDNIQQIKQHIPYQPLHQTPSLSTCVQLARENKTTLVFLATDTVNPRKDHPEVWKHAPCTFTLNDILGHDHPSWIYMDQYRSHKGESMRKYLVPLVDALVASQGRSFIGTKGSTFSGYIRRLHQNFRVKHV